MKKVKYMLLTAAMSTMLLGAGYAAWTDQLTINNSVTTGNLDVEFVNTVTDLAAGTDAYVDGSIGYNGTTDEPNSIANVTITNMYPAATAKVSLLVDNKSTIPITFSSFSATGDTAAIVPTGTVTFTDDTSNTEVTKTFTEAVGMSVKKDTDITIDYDLVAAEGVVEGNTYNVNFNPQFKQFNK